MHSKKVLVIGSGLAAIHSAYPLVEKGIEVHMIDVGFEKPSDQAEYPEKNFRQFRETVPEQYRTFLGDDFSALLMSGSTSDHADVLTGGRRGYIRKGTDLLLPLIKNNVAIIQSLAKGGLAGAWGAACGFFDKEECETVGLPFDEMTKHYKIIARRVGMSGLNSLLPLQPAAEIDVNARYILSKYESRNRLLPKRDWRIEQPVLALLTQDHGTRHGTTYRDMDYWDDCGRSVYRSRYTLEYLESFENFSYRGGILVERVDATPSGVTVHGTDISAHTPISISGDYIVMAAGAINTTKIIVRSFGKYNTPVPIFLKKNFVIPCLLPGMWRAPYNDRRHSLCQLVLESKNRIDGMIDTYAQIFSYNSLLLHKLVGFVPLPAPLALRSLAMLVPAICLLDVRFATTNEEAGTIVLRDDTGSTSALEISAPTYTHKKLQAKRMKELKRNIRSVGAIPLTTVENKYGTSSHYAGGIPFAHPSLKHVLEADANCRLLNSHDRIYIADSATWRALPAKPPAVTIMAGANRVGSIICKMITGEDPSL